MLGKSVLSLGLVIAALVGMGCANMSGGRGNGATYRTVAVEPGRDTEAAKRANEAGLEHLAKGEIEQAAKAFERALTADVEFGPAHNNLGRVYFKQKDWYKAAWEFEYAGKLLPKHAAPRNNLGLVFEEVGQLDRAVEYYREAVNLDPENIQYRSNLCRALVRRGDRTSEVRNLLERMLQQDDRPEWRVWAKRQQVRIGAQSD